MSELAQQERRHLEEADRSAARRIELSMKQKTGRFRTREERAEARRLFGLDERADSAYRISRW